MDPGKPSSSGRKYRFAPKPPRRRTPAPPAQGIESEAAEDTAEAQRLLRRITTENHQRAGNRAERKSSLRVSFDPGASTSTSGDYVTKGSSSDVADNSDSEDKGKCMEYWDYNSYYPVRLPSRSPSTGDPAILDEAEFGDNAKEMEYDEKTVNAASELGLLDSEGSQREQFLLFQFPATLPSVKRLTTTAKGKEGVSNTKSSDLEGKGRDGNTKSSELQTPGYLGDSTRCCRFEELPRGHMGKLLVYKSGAVKLKLGETLFDVTPGSDCNFHQDVAAINRKHQHFCVIGEVDKRAVVNPDINFHLSTESES